MEEGATRAPRQAGGGALASFFLTLPLQGEVSTEFVARLPRLLHHHLHPVANLDFHSGRCV